MPGDVAQGFSTPIVEIVVFVLVLTTSIGGLLWYWIHTSRKRLAQQKREAEARYREISSTLDLTKSDQDAIDLMSRHLKDPFRKYQLLQHQPAFNQTAMLAVEQGDVQPGHVSALRVKLGFAGRAVGLRPRASAEIPEGSAVLLIRPPRPPVRATVNRPSTNSFRVALDEPAGYLASGSTLTVVYQSEAGVFEFETAVLDNSGVNLELQHSEQLQLIQRRRHFRRAVELPVYVKRAGETTDPELSHFLDIGGDGASLANPSNRFKRGDDVELTFHPDSKQELNLSATVVRTSQDDQVLHVQYGNIKERARDRVYQLLFSGNRNQDESTAETD